MYGLIDRLLECDLTASLRVSFGNLQSILAPREVDLLHLSTCIDLRKLTGCNRIMLRSRFTALRMVRVSKFFWVKDRS
jgi:single-stranded DNA-specific DHH superfamily exonuclease